MSTNHNRIKVADLETNDRDKILITNQNGEIEFSDINNIKTENYNALDYTTEGKALDARQGKVLKNLIDNINASPLLVNDLISGGTEKGLTAEMGKLLQNNKVDKVPGERLITASEIKKLENLATFPPPYLADFVPNTSLPNTTGYITLKGSFFTPDMIVAIAGHTVNSVSFISDNEIKIYLTTSSNGGFYNITLNNGGSDIIFPNRFFISSGTITEPKSEDWENISATMDVSLGKTLKMRSYGNYYTAATWNKVIDYTKAFSVFFSFNTSPLGLGDIGVPTLDVIGVNSGTIFITTGGGAGYNYCKMYVGANHQFSLNPNRELWKNSIVEYRYVNGNLSIYIDGIYNFNTGLTLTENVKLKFSSVYADIANIKYVEY